MRGFKVTGVRTFALRIPGGGAASFPATENNGPTTQSVANGSPAVINFTANAADPARSGVRTVTSPVTANGSATDVLEAFVGDVNGNPVAGSVVTFSPTANITFRDRKSVV